MEKIFSQNIPNHQATKNLARDLTENYLKQDNKFTLFLEGGLGAGKTYLTREILKHLGVKETVTSPTYALVNEYLTDKKRHFAHFDFYRLETPDDFFARGFQDIAEDPNISCFVEWAEKIGPEARASFLGTKYILKIEFGIGVGMRTITLFKK